MSKPAKGNRYKAIIEKIFFDGYTEGTTDFAFDREEIISAARALEVELPKNVGDLVYSIRYRTPLPESVLETQPEGKEWIIEGVGRSRYQFRLVALNRIKPRSELVARKIPDATPEIISFYALNDEQALLAIVRYNRLIDIFLGLTTYSLQNHLRTTLGQGQQIEIDEIYIGLDRHGCHYVIPVQAKGGSDNISVVQARQDVHYCTEQFPGIAYKAISAQFMPDEVVALFELTVQGDEVKVVDERHYKLVPASEIDGREIRDYPPQG